MLGLGIGEIALIGIVILLVVGPERLPQVVRWAGKSYGQLRRTADELRRAFLIEAERLDAEDWARGGPPERTAPPPVDLTVPAPGISQEEWDTLSESVRRRLKVKAREWEP